MYRWHLADPIAWHHEARITIQQIAYGKNGLAETSDDWSAATFWYEPTPSPLAHDARRQGAGRRTYRRIERAHQRLLAELAADVSSQQEHAAGSSSRAFTSSRNPSWLPATHLLVLSSRMTSAVAASFGSMASMSLVNRSPSDWSKSLLAVKTQ